MPENPLIIVCDDDEGVRGGLAFWLRQLGHSVEAFGNGPDLLAFVDRQRPSLRAVFLLDMKMEPLSGTAVHDALIERGLSRRNPVIFLSGHGDIPLAVLAMQKGALSFVEKPHTNDTLLPTITRAMDLEAQWHQEAVRFDFLKAMWDSLSTQQRKVVRLAALGDMNKVIAVKLDIVERTVEAHLSKAFDKLGVDSRATLATTVANMRNYGIDLDAD